MDKEDLIPLKKQSKRNQKKHHASRRGTWGILNPVTRKPANPKAYRRKKFEKENDNWGSE